MTTDKRQPRSTTSKHVEELKQFLKPSGLIGDQPEFLNGVIEAALDLFSQTDGKTRHFLTVVFTREGETREDGTLISMDTVTSFRSRGYAMQLLEQWIARTKADLGRSDT